VVETNLYTNNGGFVATVQTPPWKFKPELLMWGERFFLLRQDGNYTEASGSFFVPPPIRPEAVDPG
jgi:hypothetical protein